MRPACAATNQHRGWASAHNNLDLALDRADHSKAAATPTLRTAELDPQSAEIHNNLAVLLRDLNRVTEATSHDRPAVAPNCISSI